MTNWQRLSNFFIDITLERPDAVIIDEASQELNDLYNLADHGNKDSFHSFAEGLDIPDYSQKGVLVYDNGDNETAFYQNFEEQQLDETVETQLDEIIPDNIDSRQITIGVDSFNSFNVNLPSESYIHSTDFSKYEEILDEYYSQ